MVGESPNIGLLAILELNSVGIAFIPKSNDLACYPSFSAVGIDLISDLETESVFGFAIHETLFELGIVKVTSNEDESAGSLLTLFPWGEIFVETSGKDHMHTLENEFLGHSFDSKDAFVTEEIFALTHDDLTDPHVQQIDVKLSFKLVTGRGH